MAPALLWAVPAAASFAAAGVLVLAIVRVTERLHDNDRAASFGRPDRREAGRRLQWPSEPPWWTEFEREFADYVRAGDGPHP